MKVIFRLTLTLLCLVSLPTVAHEMTMAEMQLHEVMKGDFIWQWGTGEKRPVGDQLSPQWPKGCISNSNKLHCSEQGLSGTLSIEGVGKTYSAALVKIVWLDGQTRVYTLTSGQPSVQLFGAADDRRDWYEIASAYTTLGIEHILTGIDHVLFVLGLLFLVGFNRKLIWTITAFTLAHSLTLALSSLGLLTLHSAPVEACIALSIVLVAGEALHTQPTLARRFPALLAFLFGLVHGLGFAGALKEIGLPENYLPVALLTFNLGVELGQMLIITTALGLHRLAALWPKAALGRTPILYCIGSVAAYWSWERTVDIFG